MKKTSLIDASRERTICSRWFRGRMCWKLVRIPSRRCVEIVDMMNAGLVEARAGQDRTGSRQEVWKLENVSNKNEAFCSHG
jgi:hypothetical protein